MAGHLASRSGRSSTDVGHYRTSDEKRGARLTAVGLIRHARYFILQLADSQLTQHRFAQIIRRIERLAWHPT